MKRIVLTFLMMSIFLITGFAQSDPKQDIEIIGRVMDVYGSPLKGAMVFVDSLNSNVRTDKQGIYMVKISPDTKLLTVYTKEYGLLSMNYDGQNKVSFLYKDDSKPLRKSALRKLGFKVKDITGSDEGYEDFASILDILDKRFYFAKVTDGRVKIGKGANQFSGVSDPLVLVNNQQMPIDVLTSIPTTDVKSIRVIHKSSEAAEYGGLRAANGVILITLKQ